MFYSACETCEVRRKYAMRSQLIQCFKDKQFSILGDSISTLEGFNPCGYKIFYDADNGRKFDVKEMNDTWWGKVINYFGGELLVNNSWSGSRVTKLPGSNVYFLPDVQMRELLVYI